MKYTAIIMIAAHLKNIRTGVIILIITKKAVNCSVIKRILVIRHIILIKSQIN